MFSLFSKYKNAYRSIIHKIKKHKSSVKLFTEKSDIIVWERDLEIAKHATEAQKVGG